MIEAWGRREAKLENKVCKDVKVIVNKMKIYLEHNIKPNPF
jgi:hypothetical protein